ncbi:MAG: hypothetical protein WC250_01160 [Candidatus Paceibacterota bacterium]|jgi:hypothetical protein
MSSQPKRRLTGRTAKPKRGFAVSSEALREQADWQALSLELRKVRHAGHKLPRKPDPLEVL